MSTADPQSDNRSQLTDKQRAFVLAYVQCWNASEAARQAGYSHETAGSIGHENLKKPEIRVAIDRYLQDMGLTADRILAEQMALGFANADDYLIVEEGGATQARAFNELTRSQKAAIKKIREKQTIKENPDGSMFVDRTLEYELFDKQRALDTLAKHISGREKITPPESPGKPDPDKQPAQQMVELMAQLLSQAQVGQIDPVVAKTMATLAGTLLKAQEQGNLEERIAALENVLTNQSDTSNLDFEL